MSMNFQKDSFKIDSYHTNSPSEGYWFGTDTSTEKKYLIKYIKIKSEFSSAQLFEKIKMETTISTKMHHNNIAALAGSFKEGSTYYFAYECGTGITLEKYIQNKKSLSEEEAFDIFYQLLDGLHFFHEQGFIHRNLNPENILIFNSDNQNKIFKIVNFDSSKFAAAAYTQNVGCMPYKAPELFRNQFHYNLKIDYWSLGLIYYQMIQGCLPWTDQKDGDLYNQILSFDIKKHTYQKIISSRSKKLLYQLLQIDPSNRANFWNIRLSDLCVEYQHNLKIEEINLIQTNGSQKIFYKSMHSNQWANNPIEKVFDNEEQKEFVMKKYSLQNADSELIQHVEALCNFEMRIGHEFKHKNIIPLYNYFFSIDKSEIYLMYPCSNVGTLSNWLQNNNKLSEEEAFQVFQKIFKGVHHLHENERRHQHINLNTIFVNAKDDGKIQYLLLGNGYSNHIEKLLLGWNDSMIYQAPENIDVHYKNYNYPGDYWSLGMVYFNLITGKLPFQCPSIVSSEAKSTLKNDMNSFSLENYELSNGFTDESTEIINKLLKYDPAERIQLYDLFNTKIWKKYYKKKPSAREINDLQIVSVTSSDPRFQKNMHLLKFKLQQQQASESIKINKLKF